MTLESISMCMWTKTHLENIVKVEVLNNLVGFSAMCIACNNGGGGREHFCSTVATAVLDFAAASVPFSHQTPHFFVSPMLWKTNQIHAGGKMALKPSIFKERRDTFLLPARLRNIQFLGFRTLTKTCLESHKEKSASYETEGLRVQTFLNGVMVHSLMWVT